MAANTGRFLKVNLSTGKTATESIPEQVALDFVGGGATASGISMMN